MVVDHPHEIEKKENINNYAYDVVYKKKAPEEVPRKNSTTSKGKEKASMDSTK